jgi:hypothetical protein
VPADAPPLAAAAVRQRVVLALRDASLAIHLIGALYGFVPEGEQRSIIELQSDDETYLASASSAARIIWLAPNVTLRDERLNTFGDRLQRHSLESGRLDLLTNQTIEAVKTLVLDRLKPPSKATVERTPMPKSPR